MDDGTGDEDFEEFDESKAPLEGVVVELFAYKEPPPIEPQLKVLTHSRWQKPNIEQCQHPSFVLDDKWMKCRCANCGEMVEPYAILRLHREYWDEMRRQRDSYLYWLREHEGKRIKHLARSAYCPEELKAEAKKLQWGQSTQKPLTELQQLSHRITTAINVEVGRRRDERRRKRKAGRVTPA